MRGNENGIKRIRGVESSSPINQSLIPERRNSELCGTIFYFFFFILMTTHEPELETKWNRNTRTEQTRRRKTFIFHFSFGFSQLNSVLRIPLIRPFLLFLFYVRDMREFHSRERAVFPLQEQL